MISDMISVLEIRDKEIDIKYKKRKRKKGALRLPSP
jgi:hypothetical protein